jgi:hypothetical protein
MSIQSVAQIALAIAWLVTTITGVIMLYGETRNKRAPARLRRGLTLTYAAVLLWYLVRSGSSIDQLPDFTPLVFVNWRFGPLAGALVIALMFCLTLVSDKGASLLLLLYIVAAPLILVVWHSRITADAVGLGIAVSLIAFVAGGILFWKNAFVPKANIIIFLIFVPPMFVVGSLSAARTGLGGIRLLEGQYGHALMSFLWGCVLFIPLGLVNAIDRQKEEYPWINRWWKPLVVPFWSGLNEEVIFRLFPVPLCYALLRPAFVGRPGLALIAAVLFSGITFGLTHGHTWEHFWFTGLCYGVPMAVVFATRDWEHAVGAHYMVNFVPWVMGFLKAQRKRDQLLSESVEKKAIQI